VSGGDVFRERTHRSSRLLAREVSLSVVYDDVLLVVVVAKSNAAVCHTSQSYFLSCYAAREKKYK